MQHLNCLVTIVTSIVARLIPLIECLQRNWTHISTTIRLNFTKQFS